MLSRLRLLALLVAVATWPLGVRGQELPAGTVIVANMNENSVWLVDLPSGVRRASIATRESPHEVAVSHDQRLAAVTNYGGAAGNIVQILDIAAAEVVQEIVVEGYQRLHGVAFLPGDSLLALTSERTAEVLVVDRTDSVIRRTLSTAGEASHMLSLGGTWIYTANILDGTVSRIDPTGVGATLTWPAGTRTEGVVATPDGAEVWTGSMEGGDVVGIRGSDGEVVARISQLTVPYRLGVTPDGGRIVVSDPGSGSVGVIDRSAGSLAGRVDVSAASTAAGLGNEPSPQGFTITPDGGWALVSTKGIDRIAAISLTTLKVERFLESGVGPDGIAFSPVRVR